MQRVLYQGKDRGNNISWMVRISYDQLHTVHSGVDSLALMKEI